MHTKNWKKGVLVIGLIYIILAFLGFNLPRLYCNEIKPYIQYNNALKLMNTGKYDEAISILDNIKDYKNSNDKILFAYYKEACELYDKELYVDAKYSLQGTTQSRYLTGGVPPVRFSM